MWWRGVTPVQAVVAAGRCVRAHARARRTTMVVARSGHADGVAEAEERLDVRERHRQQHREIDSTFLRWAKRE